MLNDLVGIEKELQTGNIDSSDGLTGQSEVDCTDSSDPLENTVDIHVQADPDGGQPDSKPHEKRRTRRKRPHWRILIWSLLRIILESAPVSGRM